MSNPPLTRKRGRNRSLQGPILLVALTVGGSVEAITRGPELGAQARRVRWGGSHDFVVHVWLQRRQQSEVLLQHTLSVASLKYKAAI